MTVSIAIQHMLLRLEKANRALLALENSSDFGEIYLAWSDFLIAASGFYSKLEQGSKISISTKSWFDQIKHERRTDPLLRYVHQARNADEHGLQEITIHNGPSLNVDISQTEGPISGWIVFNSDGSDGYATNGTEFLPTSIKSAQVILSPVTNRGVLYPEPCSHFGESIDDARPLIVARLAYAYLQRLVEQAIDIGI